MDAYLSIAERVLRGICRPLTAREILQSAYRLGLVPVHLHGQTQHKTLGARLSEDILERQDRSVFFRSSPGRFFLVEFIADQSLPVEHRTRFVARRRVRQLPQSKPLAFNKADLLTAAEALSVIPVRSALRLLQHGQFHYATSTVDAQPLDVLVWTFVLVERHGHVLTYRHGHYREHRDAFTHKRALSFYAPVAERDRTLFDLDDHGVISNGLRTVCMDLGLSTVELHRDSNSLATLDRFVLSDDGSSASLLGIVHFTAPDWFEPFARRLAINDLQWWDPAVPINNIEDFDPWSQAVLQSWPRGREFPRIDVA